MYSEDLGRAPRAKLLVQRVTWRGCLGSKRRSRRRFIFLFRRRLNVLVVQRRTHLIDINWIALFSDKDDSLTLQVDEGDLGKDLGGSAVWAKMQVALEL